MGRPSDVRYLKSHEWGREEGGTVAVGISDFAVEQLNKEIVYVELPQKGRKVKQGETFGVIESVKAASDLYAPVSGTVTDVNSAVVDDPAKVADEPYGGGWLIKIEASDLAELESLLSPEAYDELAASEDAH